MGRGGGEEGGGGRGGWTKVDSIGVVDRGVVQGLWTGLWLG